MSRKVDETVRKTTKGYDASDDLHATVTVLTGDDLGRVFELTTTEVVFGRGDAVGAQLHDDSLSREHARFVRVGEQWSVEDMGSTNGTFVDCRPVTERTPIFDGARVQLGDTITRFSLRNEREFGAARRLYESMVRDPLTGCYNRHYLDEHLPYEFSYSGRHDTPLSVLFVDVDRLRSVNQAHGDDAGDTVLVEVARYLLVASRAEDVVARWGGDQFVMVVRGNDGQRALAMAERLREGVEALVITHDDQALPVTVTIGVASMEAASAHEQADELVARADAALYMGKRDGGNRVEVG